MQSDEVLQRALNLLFEAVPAGTQIILFGSRASGEARPDSDYDFLVVEPQVDVVRHTVPFQQFHPSLAVRLSQNRTNLTP